MNTACKSICFASMVLSLAACAGMSEHRVAAYDTTLPGDAIDADYVSAVERVTKHAGIKLVWVNPPRERDRDPYTED